MPRSHFQYLNTIPTDTVFFLLGLFPKSAQIWVNVRYPFRKHRDEIKKIDIRNQNLLGSLDLEEFTSLEKILCSHNKISSLNLANSITVISCGNNKFFQQDLSIFSHLVNLKELWLENNNFVDSLQPLHGLSNLELLNIVIPM